MLRIAITGGVASGKSTVARAFEARGAPLVDADVVAREVVAPSSEGLQEVVAAFGEWVLTGAGELDRQVLREHVFTDEAARQRLEAIIHPRVRTRMSERMRALADERHPYAIAVIPLLIETDQTAAHDRNLVVDVPESVQIERMRERDGASCEHARRVLASQAGRWQRLRYAHDVVANADAVAPATSIEPQVASLDRKYRRLSESTS